MKILVPIKQILDPAGVTVRRDKERIFVNVEEYVLGPGSQAALEAALRLRDALGGDVTALSLGEPRADDALREALALGCDAAYLLHDDAFAEADVSVAVRALAAAVQKLGGADLVLVGRASGDTGAGQVGPRLAQALDYAPVTDAYALDVVDGALRATRRWGAGYAAVHAPLPAVVSVAPEAFPLRYAPGERIIRAYREWEVPVWGAADLGLGEADLAPILAFRREGFPPPLELGEVFRGDPSTVAQDVVMELRLQHLIG
jgi:electron transfer flavoprotein beta subunit